MWEVETLMEKRGISLSFLKKEDRSNCASYRGITLLNVSVKVFKRIILNRLKKVDDKLNDQQAGFR